MIVDSFPRLLQALRSPKLGAAAAGATCTATDPSGCQLPDLRIGVVSSDLGAGAFSLQSCESTGGDGGKLHSGAGKLAPPGCPTPKDAWIAYTPGPSGAVTNVQDTSGADPAEQVNKAFGCIAYLGGGGCGFEQPLESTRRALDGANPGFLRPGSTLVVLLVTDEDDCSARKTELYDPAATGTLGPLNSFRCTRFGLTCDEPLTTTGVKHNCAPGQDWLYAASDYVSFLRALRPAGNLVVAALAGPAVPFEVGVDGTDPTLKPSCSSGVAGYAVPAVRLGAVIAGLGANGLYNQGVASGQQVEVNICSQDFGPFLRLIGERVAALY